MQYLLEKPVQGNIGTDHYQCHIAWRNGTFIADEPLSSGGKDLGPDPYTLLLSSLAACTLITLRMYIDRKAWNISAITVNVNMYQELHEGKTKTWIDRTLIFSDAVDEDQKIRLQEMAKHCPISKILEGDISIQTNVLDSNR